MKNYKKTKTKLINKEKTKVIDYVKNPLIIKNNNQYKQISEKILQKLILEDITSFLEELGEGFTFIKKEYKIKIEENKTVGTIICKEKNKYIIKYCSDEKNIFKEYKLV